MVMLLRFTLTAAERWMAPFSSVFSLPPTVPSEAAPLLVFALVKFIQFRLMLRALMKLAPRVEMFWMVPPVPDDPFPLTVKPAVAPVLFRMMPLAAPLTLMLRKVKPLAPIVVLTTLSPVPVPEVIVLTIVVLSCVALTVAPLPVALKPTPEVVVRLNPPVKVTVPPVFVRSIAFAVEVLAVI